MMQRTTSKAGGESYWFWCPGCETHHRYVTKLGEGETGSTWQFNGNMEKPTFSPSLMVNRNLKPEYKAAGGHRCHLYVTDGVVRFLSDCTHSLAGQNLPVEDPRFNCD